MAAGLVAGLVFFLLGLIISPWLWAVGIILLAVWLGSLDTRISRIEGRLGPEQPIPPEIDPVEELERRRVRERMEAHARATLEQRKSGDGP